MRRRRSIVATAGIYLGALLTTLFVRNVLSGPPEVQFLAGLLVGTGLAGIAELTEHGRSRTSPPQARSSGWSGTIILMAALSLTFIAEQLAPDAWPLLAIGLILPTALVALDLVRHSRTDAAPDPTSPA